MMEKIQFVKHLSYQFLLLMDIPVTIDLTSKQFMLDIFCSGDGDVPLLLRAADGNEADSSVFAHIFCEFKRQFDCEGLMVADSALYRDKNLKILGNLKWLSRTPLTIKQAKQLIYQLREADFIESLSSRLSLV